MTWTQSDRLGQIMDDQVCLFTQGMFTPEERTLGDCYACDRPIADHMTDSEWANRVAQLQEHFG